MNKNRILKSAVLTVLTLLWMVLIFMMSGADDDESKAQSGSICTFLCETFVDGFEDMTPEEQQSIEESLSFPVRKCAHLTEYAVLGALLAATAASYTALQGILQGHGSASASRTMKPLVLPFIIGVLYAVSDEIHQLFVPGRAGQLRDVLIDSAGILIGMCLYRVLSRRRTS